MSDYLSTFISLFGSISAISIAFLIILYDSLKKKYEKSKLNYINEIKSFIDCPHTIKLGLLNSDEKSYLKIKLLSEYDCGRIDKEKTDKIISILNETINNENTDIVDKDHLIKYHQIDINYEFDLFINDKDYLNNKFLSFAKISIAVPFLFTFMFILIAKFQCFIIYNFSNSFFDYMIIILVVIGFIFIYFNALKAIKNLNKID